MATMAVQAPRTHRSKEIRRHALIYLGLMPFLIIAVFPIFWMLITALKQEPDLYRMDIVPFWFHLPPTWKNFDFLFNRTFYGDWIVNTMAISFWVSVITLLTAVPAGYALARLRLPFAENLGIGIFMTYLVPAIILFLPLARVVSMLDLQDSWWSLVAIYPTFTIPFCTWLLMGFFKTVPFEIEEAAMIDGCGQLGALLRVVLPVSWPGLITSVHLLLHAVHAGFPLFAGVRLHLGAEAGPAGRGDRADPGRRLLLGLADGGRAAGRRAGRDPL